MDVKISAKFKEIGKMNADFRESDSIKARFGETSIVHTGDYNELYNKPCINEVELTGNHSFEDLGDHLLTNIEIKKIFDRVFKGGQ